MGWGCEAVLSITINGTDINELIEEKELLLYATELAECDISLSAKVKNPLFFEEFNWYLSFTQKANKFRSDFTIITDAVINENYMGSPIEVLEILLFAQYLSTKKATDVIEVGVGDASVVWMDIEFKNGISTNVTVKTEEGIDEPIDAFNCNEKEMTDFFAVPMHERLMDKNDSLVESVSPKKSFQPVNEGNSISKIKSWNSKEGGSIRINETFIEEKELLLYVSELSNQEISLETKIKKPIFFKVFNTDLTSSSKVENYQSDFSSVIGAINNGFLDSPIDTLEILLFSQYLSMKNPNEIITFFMGDAFSVALDIEFRNGIGRNCKVSKFGDPTPGVFNCSAEEMTEFFSVPILDRLIK